MPNESDFKQGDLVTIPKGALVRTMHPAKKSYRTCRRQTIRVHHVLGSSSAQIIMLRPKDRLNYKGCEAEFARFDELILDADTHPDRETARRLYREAYEMRVYSTKPSLCWPGTGGYWNKVDIDDLVA